ncbi:MAG: 8-oxo-dGTP diphosphatase [Candidatus Pristimantibacillus lignocellulolyticus]|uniref:8-oxo-dGTP diphosphatase n=1 Tax=Candidatus Pristimantibacillus lignocellulolyticus TaxID=2994561 RepID=A0A9J6ZK74_9BACL|nr:MAG: 8-oxo-dGTP diphosphatase [Candidatus Pristimantibacillus lignocellulolyticus]
MLKYTICFIRRGDELLLLNRIKAPNMGLWNGVGGKIEAFELPIDGIVREIEEETGLRVQQVQDAGIVKWISSEGESGMYLYYCDLPIDTVYATPIEKDEGTLAWKSIDWVLHPENEGVVDNMKHFLPHVLRGNFDCEHTFTYDANGIVNYVCHSLTTKKLSSSNA